MIKRAVIDKIGLLDEKFFLYLEDVDFCRRCRQAGYKVLYYPAAKIIHHHMQSSKSDYSVEVISEINSLMYYFKKYQQDASWLIFFIYLRVYLRIVKYFFLSLISEKYRAWLKAFTKALWKMDI